MVRGRSKWRETKRNWHTKVPDFNRGNKTGTEINIARVGNDKRGTDESQKPQPAF